MNLKCDQKYKIILAGSSGVGKSSLLFRFVDNIYQTNLLSTIGVDFKFKILDVNNKKIRLQIWDTAGSQHFKSIVSAYYRGANAIILVYDLTNKITWNDIKEFWMVQVNKYKQQDCQVMLIGNKSDQQYQEKISEQDIQEFLRTQNISLYYKTSAKNGQQILQAFEKLTIKLMQKNKRDKKIKQNQNNKITSLKGQSSQKACSC